MFLAEGFGPLIDFFLHGAQRLELRQVGMLSPPAPALPPGCPC